MEILRRTEEMITMGKLKNLQSEMTEPLAKEGLGCKLVRSEPTYMRNYLVEDQKRGKELLEATTH